MKLKKPLSTRDLSTAQEKYIAKITGGKVQANSGATVFQKGDAKDAQFLIEAKTMMTKQKSVSIKEAWIEKIKEEAFAENREHWTIAFNFGGVGNTENYYIISEEDFLQFEALLEENDG